MSTCATVKTTNIRILQTDQDTSGTCGNIGTITIKIYLARSLPIFIHSFSKL